MGSLLGLIIFLMPLLVIYLAYLRYGKKGILSFVENKVIYHTPVTRIQYEKLDALLEEKNTFYRALSIHGRAKFVNRIFRFNKEVPYRGMNGLEVTDEMKFLVASAAVQLTYGLKFFLLENLEGIKIYPSIFYSKLYKNNLRGLMPAEGCMLLSWEHVERGFFIPDDRYNLALHEMAHALKLGLKYAYNFDIDFYSFMEKWTELGSAELTRMQQSRNNFLRDYASTNMEEFFAVSVEHFFEAPYQFQRNLPELYDHLCKMLNLNPLNKRGDYKLMVTGKPFL